MDTVEGSDLNQLAKRVYFAERTIDVKTKMLQHLKDGGDRQVVEADLDSLSFFLGFEPDSSTDLRASSVIRVTPRSVPVADTNEARANCIEVLKKLKLFNELARGERLTLITWFKHPWMPVGEWVELVWYSYFTDEVSIRFSDGGYKIIPRKELQ